MANHIRADLMLVDKSSPVFGELLSRDNWKVFYDENSAAVYLPAEKTSIKKVVNEKDVPPKKEVISYKIAKKPE